MLKNLEIPVATYRARTAMPRAPQHTVVRTAPTRTAPTRTAPVVVNTTTTAPKWKITNVHITDTANRAISGTYNKKGVFK